MSGVKRKPRTRVATPLPEIVPEAAMPSRMPERPGRWKLVWRRQKRILGRAMAGVVLLAALLLAGLVAQSFGQGASLGDRLADATGRLGLRVVEIRIEGREKAPIDAVLDAVGVTEGDPILGFSVARARVRIEAIAWIEKATVERRLPGLIVVKLVERRPFAVWQLDGVDRLIDRAGEEVKGSDVAAFAAELPRVVGPGAATAAVALMEMLATQPDIQARMIAAVRVGDRRWNLRMTNGADVLLPEGAEVAALARLAALQSSHALLDRPLQVVDLRLPDRLVIRPAGDKLPTARRPT